MGDRETLEQVANHLHLDGVPICLAKLEAKPKSGTWLILSNGAIAQAALDLQIPDGRYVVEDNVSLKGVLPRNAMGVCDHLKSHGIPAVIFCCIAEGAVYAVFVPPRSALLSGEEQVPQVTYIDQMRDA